jgi:hypothetical protein
LVSARNDSMGVVRTGTSPTAPAVATRFGFLGETESGCRGRRPIF